MDDLKLMRCMRETLPGDYNLSLVLSEKPLTVVRTVALLGSGTLAQLGEEFGAQIDARRFRANLSLDLPEGFAEERLAGSDVQVGAEAGIACDRTDSTLPDGDARPGECGGGSHADEAPGPPACGLLGYLRDGVAEGQPASG